MSQQRMLRIDVRRRGGPLLAGEREMTVRSVLLALSRFEPRLERVAVELIECSSVLGGVERLCRMRAFFDLGLGAEVEMGDDRLDRAVARASRRLATRVAAILDPAGRGGPLLVPQVVPGSKPVRAAPAQPPRRRPPRSD